MEMATKGQRLIQPGYAGQRDHSHPGWDGAGCHEIPSCYLEQHAT